MDTRIGIAVMACTALLVVGCTTVETVDTGRSAQAQYNIDRLVLEYSDSGGNVVLYWFIKIPPYPPVETLRQDALGAAAVESGLSVDQLRVVNEEYRTRNPAPASHAYAWMSLYMIYHSTWEYSADVIRAEA